MDSVVLSTDELPHNWKPTIYTEERDVEAHDSLAVSFNDLPAGRYVVVLVAVDSERDPVIDLTGGGSVSFEAPPSGRVLVRTPPTPTLRIGSDGP